MQVRRDCTCCIVIVIKDAVPPDYLILKLIAFFLSAIAKYIQQAKERKMQLRKPKGGTERRQNSFRYVNKLAYDMKLSALVDFKNGKVLIFNRQYYSQFSEVQIKGFDTTPPK